jgi:hypothetical protein
MRRRAGVGSIVVALVLLLLGARFYARAQFVPPAPDYANPAAWAVLPGHPSGADAVPAGVPPPGNAPHKVDAFFIHPTTFLALDQANAAYDQGGLSGAAVDRGTLRFQASAFNACCDIYAPHYRQASISAFIGDRMAHRAAIDLAYRDVQAAFDWYIAHANHGRPFILASHSQGSLHALRLLQERIIGTALQQRLVAAYIVGEAVPVSIEASGVKLCRSASQTGCVVAWNTVRDQAGGVTWLTSALAWQHGDYAKIAGRPIVCVNPLNWILNGAADASANLGAVPGTRGSENVPAAVAGLTGARCVNGLLQVAIPDDAPRGFNGPLTGLGSYHIYDYNLFYMNIRANASERVAQFLTH